MSLPAEEQQQQQQQQHHHHQQQKQQGGNPDVGKTSVLNTFRDLIASEFNEKDISICHTDFFKTLQNQGWEKARCYIRPDANEKERWESNDVAATFDTNALIIPCYIEESGSEGKWVIILRHKKFKKGNILCKTDVLDPAHQPNVLPILELMINGTPIMSGSSHKIRLGLREENCKTEEDSEARVAAWMYLFARASKIATRRKQGMLGGVHSALEKEGTIPNLVQERRKWLNECLEKKTLLEIIEVDTKKTQRLARRRMKSNPTELTSSPPLKNAAVVSETNDEKSLPKYRTEQHEVNESSSENLNNSLSSHNPNHECSTKRKESSQEEQQEQKKIKIEE